MKKKVMMALGIVIMIAVTGCLDSMSNAELLFFGVGGAIISAAVIFIGTGTKE